MKPDAVKQALYDTIQAMTECKWLFSARPGRDNTRNRKFPFHKVISSILASFSCTTIVLMVSLSHFRNLYGSAD